MRIFLLPRVFLFVWLLSPRIKLEGCVCFQGFYLESGVMLNRYTGILRQCIAVGQLINGDVCLFDNS